jgi:acyl dehydratase
MLTHRTREELGVSSQEREAGNRGRRNKELIATKTADGEQRTSLRLTDRHWKDVGGGEALPGFSLDITPRRVFLQVSGSQDWYPVHFDAAFARKGGHSDVFMNTGFLQAALVRVITDWMGDKGFLKRLRFEMRRQQRPGDTMVCSGKVVSKYEKNGESLVDLQIWAENEREGVTTPATATVSLPRQK